jgi:hypothetical protein
MLVRKTFNQLNEHHSLAVKPPAVPNVAFFINLSHILSHESPWIVSGEWTVSVTELQTGRELKAPHFVLELAFS